MDDDTYLAAFLIAMPMIVMAMVLSIIMFGSPGTGVFLLILSLALASVSILQFTGRGAWFIAGFNTMSDEERAQYNPKKVARGGGMITLGSSILCASISMNTTAMIAGLIVFIALLILGWIYSAKCAKL